MRKLKLNQLPKAKPNIVRAAPTRERELVHSPARPATRRGLSSTPPTPRKPRRDAAALPPARGCVAEGIRLRSARTSCAVRSDTRGEPSENNRGTRSPPAAPEPPCDT